MWQLFIWLQKHFYAKKGASNSNMLIWYSASKGVRLPSPTPRLRSAKNLPQPDVDASDWSEALGVVLDSLFESYGKLAVMK